MNGDHIPIPGNGRSTVAAFVEPRSAASADGDAGGFQPRLRGGTALPHCALARDRGVVQPWSASQAEGYTHSSAEGLFFRAHDLKGLGGTDQYPLVTRLAGSMCRLLDNADQRMAAPLPLLEAHIQAIKAVVRDKIQTDDHPVGKALAEELEGQVAAFKG